MNANPLWSWRRSGLFSMILVFLVLGPAAGNDLRADEPGPGSVLQGAPLHTTDGRVFHDVTIVGVDPNGLLFKHARGAGKVRFEELSPEIQAHFSYDPAAAAAFERRGKGLRGGKAVPQAPAAAGLAGGSPITVTFRSRVVLPSSRSSAALCAWGPGEAWSLTGCGPTLANAFWPYQWGRWHPGLAYTRFPCRQAAERDFLISTGILPRPYGVRTWRYWR